MVEVKENYKINEGVKELENLERVMDNNKKVKTDIPDHFCFNPTSSSSPKDKDTNKEQEDETDKVMNNEMKENLYSCTKCDYKVKKEATLKRHIITKHEEHVCKECKEK